jgi:hypothetical protein
MQERQRGAGAGRNGKETPTAAQTDTHTADAVVRS